MRSFRCKFIENPIKCSCYFAKETLFFDKINTIIHFIAILYKNNDKLQHASKEPDAITGLDPTDQKNALIVNRPLSASTQKKIFGQFETLLNKAVKASYLNSNPCRKLDASLKPRGGFLSP